jgi:hypothetical protein
MSFNVTIQSLDASQQTLESDTALSVEKILQDYMETLVGDGVIGVVTGFEDNTFDATGYLSDPTPMVTYDNYDLDLLPENSIGIVVETFPYTSTFASNNNFISNYSTVSDFAEPTIKRASTIDEKSYELAFSDTELQGLISNFSGPSTLTTEFYINDTVNSLAAQAYQSSVTKKVIFKSTPAPRISARNISSRAYFNKPQNNATQADASIDTMDNSTPMTSNSQMGY